MRTPSRRAPARVLPTLSLALAAAALAAGCTSTAAPTGPEGAPPPITVTASDTTCVLSTTSAPAGTISFSVRNTGTQATEFYVYGEGDRIVGEVENVGPGTTRPLIVQIAEGGTYTTACTPGQAGDGLRAPFTVTGAAPSAAGADPVLAAAVADYRGYVVEQVDDLVARTRDFAAAVARGDVATARALYPTSRIPWERVEPVAESFGDIDPRIDGREDDERDPGVAFTGFHRLEKDLWVTGPAPDSAAVADRLVADVTELQARVRDVPLTPVALANGAKELLDEVATTKVTGEEERYSHTDLWDVRANLDGARAAVDALRPALDRRDPALGPVLDRRFAEADGVLEGFRAGDGYRRYTALTPDDTRRLSVAVDALGEPVSQVAGTVAT